MAAAALVTLFMAAVEAFSVMVTAFVVFTVVTTAAFVVVMVSAIMSFAMVMPAFVTFSVMMVMVVALGFGIIFQRSIRKGFHRSIRRTLNSGIEPDACVGKRGLCAYAYASADQGVSLHGLQEACKGAVTASIGVDDLLVYNPAVLGVIQLELRGMPEVLEDLSVFICDCDSHGFSSFLNDFLMNFYRFVFTMSACNQQPFPVHKDVGDLFSRAVIDCRHRSPGYVHSGGAGFLCEPFVVQKPQRFELVNGHPNAFRGCDVIRRKAAIDRKLLDPAAPEWSWHKLSFPTYVINSITG